MRAVLGVGGDVVHVGGDDDLGPVVTVQIRHGGVVIEDAVGVSVPGQLGPAGTQGAGVLVDPGVDLVVDGAGHDDLQRPVAVQIVDGETAQLAARWVWGQPDSK